MKVKTYNHGKNKYKAYLKKVGSGYEVGLKLSGNSLFIGNFIHVSEANTWFSNMNKEIGLFSKRYWITAKSPINFYKKFLGNHLYKSYYTWVNKCLTKHNRTFEKELSKDIKKYRLISKNWQSNEKTILKKVA